MCDSVWAVDAKIQSQITDMSQQKDTTKPGMIHLQLHFIQLSGIKLRQDSTAAGLQLLKI